MVSMELNSFGGDEFHSEVVADQGDPTAVTLQIADRFTSAGNRKLTITISTDRFQSSANARGARCCPHPPTAVVSSRVVG